MNYFTVSPSRLSGELTIPPSKSQTLRALLFGTLCRGKSVVHRYLSSPDTSAMIEACKLFGGTFAISDSAIEIEGVNGAIKCPDNIIDAGNSGLVLRFSTALAALSTDYTLITGDHSIRTNRAMQPLLDGLCQLGAEALSTRRNGLAPLIVRGPMRSGKATISGEDSQPVSALLIAAAFSQATIELEVINPGEKPWVGLTLSWLDRFKVPYENRNFSQYRIQGGSYNGFEYTVPGDLSTLAFPIAAALLTDSELAIHNVDLSDCQGDKQVIAVFQQMGAPIEIDAQNCSLYVKRKKGPLRALSIDINDFIDGIAILAVVGCYAEGEMHLKNAAVARTKECDRICCLALELRKMGAEIEELSDGLVIRGSCLHGAHVHSHQDHRMAMALTVAALAAHGESRIEHTACIAKTYPNFHSQFRSLGAKIL